jgi:hypothetical protein
MSTRFERNSALVGVLAVALWVVGFVLAQVVTNPPADNATDAQVLAWVQDKANYLTGGGWLFMIGCICFIWFAGALRSRLAAAEGGHGALATLAFGGALVSAVSAMGLPAGDFAASLNKNDISASTAGALHQLSVVFFVFTELSAVVMLVAVGLVAWRTRVLPRWWGAVGIVLGVVLLVGPIGWLGVIFGLPAWTLGTAALLALRPAEAFRASAAHAVA